MRSNKSEDLTKPVKWLIILCLVVAGEMIFALPFHVARFFRPTMLLVFNLSNTDFGDVFAVYGIMAMISYFPGGIIADRFSSRKLMTFSLLATGLGGIYLSFIPGQIGLSILFGFWGITTILLFWAALIRSTREWGGKLAQGRAFGILDGGRGLFSAVAATIAVFFLATFFPADLDTVSGIQRTMALKAVIYFYTIITFGTAAMVWFFMPDSNKNQLSSSRNSINGIWGVFKNLKVWLQAIIVVCAYCAYKGLDFYGLYAVDILDMNEVSAAGFVSNSNYIRPIAAIGAGFLADKITTRKVIIILFLMLMVAYIFLNFLMPASITMNIILLNILVTYVAVYALRGVYFALFEESNVSENITGISVGLISVVGFTPEIFLSSIAGRILDASPGLPGYHNFFLFLSLFAGLGLLSTFILARIIRRRLANFD